MNDFMLDYDEYEIQCNVGGYGYCRVIVSRDQAMRRFLKFGEEPGDDSLRRFVVSQQPTPVGLPRSIKEKASGIPD